MKRVLLYILLSIFMAVLAQAQVDESESPDNEIEQAGDVEQQVDDELPEEESEDTEPSDTDFKPSEEISEDYPVPLPSDI